jgi:hypothetical protein
MGDAVTRLQNRTKPPRPQRTAAQRARRRANRNPLYDPTAQLGGFQLKRAAQNLVDLQYGPQQAALERAQGNIQTQGDALTKRASDYYLQIAREEQGNVDRMGALNALLNERVNAAGDTAQGQIKDAGEQARALQEQTAAAQQGIQAGDRVSLEEQAARDRSAVDTQGAIGAGAAETRNYAGLADLGRRSREMQGGETQQRLLNLVANQLAENRGQQTDLAGQRGNAMTQQLLNLRQQGFENLVTQEGLGIKKADLQAQIQQDQTDAQLAKQRIRQQARQARRQARLARRGQDITARGQDLSAETQRRGQDLTSANQELNRANQRRLVRLRAKYGGTKANEPADSRKTKAGIVNAQTDIQDMLRTGTVPPGLRAALKDAGAGALLKRPMNIDTARRVIIALGGSGVSAQAAAELAKYGYLRPSTRAKLRAAGVKVPRSWAAGPTGIVVPNRPGVTL